MSVAQERYVDVKAAVDAFRKELEAAGAAPGELSPFRAAMGLRSRQSTTASGKACAACGNLSSTAATKRLFVASSPIRKPGAMLKPKSHAGTMVQGDHAFDWQTASAQLWKSARGTGSTRPKSKTD
jgi:hypothetical protein